MSLTSTPSSNRLHIGIFGRRNSGKSSLINAITNQNTALISDVAGTTTDPVYKAMEIHGIGPCILIDTAGFDDIGELGSLRVEKTQDALLKTDVAILVVSDCDLTLESQWVAKLKKQKTPIITVINKCDILSNTAEIANSVKETLKSSPIIVSAKEKLGIEDIIDSLIRCLPEDYEQASITGSLVKEDDVVLLVMPQDIQAPKGRLILPQVQTIRDLLDKKCIAMCVTTDKLSHALHALSAPPKLIITDSQVFAQVWAKKPRESMLTSFSVLMAAVKGDIHEFVTGANAINQLTEHSRVLIAEACTHLPVEDDIGRVQLPRMLRKKAGKQLAIDVVSGPNFPEDLSKYDLIIHCGACMFNRRYVLSRIAKAKHTGVSITNYGIAIASLTGILDKIQF